MHLVFTRICNDGRGAEMLELLKIFKKILLTFGLIAFIIFIKVDDEK
jgi:hypothetical protein